MLSPVIGFLATVAGGVASPDLTPASGCQDHTSSPSASSTLVRSTIRVHRIPSRAGDVAQRPSEWDWMAVNIKVIWVRRQVEILKNRKYFFTKGLDMPQLEGEQMTN